MKELSQNTDEWLNWRKEGIGSSDAPIIMGVSPWCTPYELWRQKLGLSEPQKENFVTQKGHDTEPRSRAIFNLNFDLDMEPALVQHKKYPWLRSSLDGYDEKRVLEIKYQGKDSFIASRDEKIVPEKYYPQVQHQLMVTGADLCYYCAYNDVFDDIAVVEVKPDAKYCKEMFVALASFWEKVENKIQPPFIKGDYKPMVRKGLAKLIKAWRLEFNQIDPSLDRLNKLEKGIIGDFKHERMRFREVFIRKDPNGKYRFWFEKD